MRWPGRIVARQRFPEEMQDEGSCATRGAPLNRNEGERQTYEQTEYYGTGLAQPGGVPPNRNGPGSCRDHCLVAIVGAGCGVCDGTADGDHSSYYIYRNIKVSRINSVVLLCRTLCSTLYSILCISLRTCLRKCFWTIFSAVLSVVLPVVFFSVFSVVLSVVLCVFVSVVVSVVVSVQSSM